MKRNLVFLFFSLAFVKVDAQMKVSNSAPYNDPSYMVNEVLFSNGETASNVTFSGDARQLGFFSDGWDGNHPIGMDSGLVLTSGSIFVIPGGNFAHWWYLTTGTPDLLAVANSVTSNPAAGSMGGPYDEAVLEFDFVASGDVVRFEFVFASEEYKRYINTVFNDAFGFFLSGPGISGPYALSAENYALVPGTNYPITISTIHDSLNEQYYIDNEIVGVDTNDNHAFNGFTTVIQIRAPVQCGETYHFKFAIADISDGWLDSGIFLKARGFSTKSIVEVDVATVSVDSSIIEGCSEATLNFVRNDTSGNATFYYGILGNAVNGVDYNLIADSVSFLAGEDSVSITITPTDDGLVEGTDTVIIAVYSINGCGDTTVSIDYLFIHDPAVIHSNGQDTTLVCLSPTVPISVNPSGGVAPYTYIWTNSSGDTIGTNSTVVVDGSSPGIYYVAITDFCQVVTFVDTIEVNINYIPLTVDAGNDLNMCPEASSLLSAVASNGLPPYSYIWNPGSLSGVSVTVNPAATTTYIVEVTDACANTASDEVLVVDDYVPMTVSINPLPLLCIGDSSSIESSVSNGKPSYSYSWTEPGGASFSGNPMNYPSLVVGDFLLSVVVTDACNQTITASTGLTVVACEVHAPNVMTPNEDGMNDKLIFTNLEFFPTNHLVVYNRWGQVVFEKDTYKNDWDGEEASDGTYFYILDLNDKKEMVLKGSLTILRN